MVTIGNGHWRIRWNEQNNEMHIDQVTFDRPLPPIMVSGRVGKELAQLILAALELPQGTDSA